MSVTTAIDGFQRRHPAAGFPLAVIYKYADDQGSYLAALITYYAFLALFPLLLLLSTVLGILLRGDPHLQQQVLHSALGQFPIIGAELGNPRHLGGGTVGLLVGILGSLYGGLGVAQAAQHAMNTAWAVPRNARPNPFTSRGRSLLLLATVGLAVLATTVLSGLGGSAGAYGATIGGTLKVLLIVAAVMINSAAFILGFRIAAACSLSVRDVAPGAVAAAVGWQLLQTFGALYVGHVVKHSSGTNGIFTLVLGLIAFIYAAAVTVVFCAEANVVRVQKLHPRSLLTPFTDDVDLTRADRKTYTEQATAQRHKAYQDIDVTFNSPRDADPPEDDDP